MRYDNNKILNDPKRYYDTSVYPKFEALDTDIYIISRDGDRLDNLAYEYYQDATWWWVIARANNVTNGSFIIPSGIRIRIPYPLTYVDINNKIKETRDAR